MSFGYDDVQFSPEKAYTGTVESKQFLVTLSIHNGHVTQTMHMVVSAESVQAAGDRAHDTSLFKNGPSVVISVVSAVEI